MYLADPGEARGCSTNTSYIDSLIHSLIQSWFVKKSFRRRHGLMVEDGAFSHAIGYVTIFKEILNFEGHPNRITGSKVTAILLNGWNLIMGRASAVKGLRLQPAQQVCFFMHYILGSTL